MLLIGLCIGADDRGELVQTRRQLASFPGASASTIDACILTLDLANCLVVHRAGRDDMGSFGANRYCLRLDNPKVRTMFEFWAPVARRSLARHRKDLETRHNQQDDRIPPIVETTRPLPKTSPGPYKDSRASSSSSSTIPSFPNDVLIDDAILRSRAMQIWDSVGEGVDPDKIYDLIRSLVIEIPKALALGYSFEEDVLPCLTEATSYHRSERLWSFKVVFERDLPVFRRKRLRQLQKREA